MQKDTCSLADVMTPVVVAIQSIAKHGTWAMSPFSRTRMIYEIPEHGNINGPWSRLDGYQLQPRSPQLTVEFLSALFYPMRHIHSTNKMQRFEDGFDADPPANRAHGGSDGPWKSQPTVNCPVT